MYERITKDAPKFAVITVSELVNKFKINGSVARTIIRDMASKNLIKLVGDAHSKFFLYTGAQAKAAAAPAAPEKK